LISPAFERPNCGRSKAGGDKSFGALFSKSAAFFRPTTLFRTAASVLAALTSLE
jgi:hypothetical protein